MVDASKCLYSIEFLVSLLFGGAGSIFVAHDANAVPTSVALHVFWQEETVDFFQGQVAGLGVEEPDDGYKGKIGAHEDEIGLPADAVDEHGRDHDNEEVPAQQVSKDGCELGTSVDITYHRQ